MATSSDMCCNVATYNAHGFNQGKIMLKNCVIILTLLQSRNIGCQRMIHTNCVILMTILILSFGKR